MRIQVVGAGPNGLAAAIVLQRAGCDVVLRERFERAGGGLRTEALTLPGYVHDLCAAAHPLALASPCFRSLQLDMEWVHAPFSLAHPFDDGTAAVLGRDLAASAATLGRDADAWLRLLEPLVEEWDAFAPEILAPLHLPRDPLRYARFARHAVFPAVVLARRRFRGERARALFAGLAAHGTLPLERVPSAAFGLVLAVTAHAAGWPLVMGGSQRLADALLARFLEAGGTLSTGDPVESLGNDVAMLDVSPRALLRLAGPRLSARDAARLRAYRYGPGVHKVEWVLRAPIPWRAAECAAAGTVHLGGTMGEIARALEVAVAGRMPDRPFVLLGQPTRFDPSRAPAGGHIAWAYCCVPFGATHDCTSLIEAQVERFAPGFGETIVARWSSTAATMEQHAPNLVGGSLGGGVQTLPQFFLGPLRGSSPYRVRKREIYLCSASTPPGPGSHGMCGYHAAQTLLRDLAS